MTSSLGVVVLYWGWYSYYSHDSDTLVHSDQVSSHWWSTVLSADWSAIVLCSTPSVPQPVFTITEKAPTTRASLMTFAPASQFQGGLRPFSIVS